MNVKHDDVKNVDSSRKATWEYFGTKTMVDVAVHHYSDAQQFVFVILVDLFLEKLEIVRQSAKIVFAFLLTQAHVNSLNLIRDGQRWCRHLLVKCVNNDKSKVMTECTLDER
ncbi:Uncharacterised protein r2_g2865 [Pycnogonum litorale]